MFLQSHSELESTYTVQTSAMCHFPKSWDLFLSLVYDPDLSQNLTTSNFGPAHPQEKYHNDLFISFGVTGNTDINRKMKTHKT